MPVMSGTTCQFSPPAFSTDDSAGPANKKIIKRIRAGVGFRNFNNRGLLM
jgi:hypothetical protein